MNERIQELAEQAMVTVTCVPYFDNGELKTEQTVFDKEKFALSIVKECAKIAEKEQAYNDGHEIHVNINQCILIEFGL